MKCCFICCLFTRCLLTSKVCSSSWLVTHSREHTRSGKGVGAEILVADHKNDELSKPFCLCYFSKLFVCPGSQSLPLSLNVFVINMDETWGEERKAERFESNTKFLLNRWELRLMCCCHLYPIQLSGEMNHDSMPLSDLTMQKGCCH